MSERCVVMFTKPARPGRVKTRLIGAVNAEDAARLHAAFIVDMLEKLRGGPFELRIAWALDDGEELPTGSAVPGWRQRGADLGERLYQALARAGRRHRYVAAIGSDHPEIARAEVDAAFRHLEGGSDVVLGPVADGGYYLVAVRSERLHRRLFAGIAWSSETVLASTRERCSELGLSVTELDKGSDVDRPEDLERLRRRLRRSPHLAPRTAALLAGWYPPSASTGSESG